MSSSSATAARVGVICAVVGAVCGSFAVFVLGVPTWVGVLVVGLAALAVAASLVAQHAARRR